MAPWHLPILEDVESGFPTLGDSGAKAGFNCVSPMGSGPVKVSLRNRTLAGHDADELAITPRW